MTPGRAVAGALLTAAVLSCAACSDSRPVEQRALVLAVGVDPAHRPGAALGWTFVFSNVTATASSARTVGNGTEVFSVEVHAPDLPTALARAQGQVTRQIYLGDLEAVALGLGTPANVAERVVSSIVEMGQVPDSFLVLATPDPTARLLTLNTLQEVIPTYFVTTFLNCSDCHAFALRVRGWRFWADAKTPGLSPVAPILRADAGHLALAGVAVYRPGSRPALRMPPDIATGLGYLTGTAVAATVSDSADGRPLTVDHVRDRVSARIRHVSGRIEVALTIHVSGAAVARGGGVPATATEAATERLARRVLLRSLAALAWANRARCDPFGFTTRALLEEPRTAYALKPGRAVWQPIDAHVTVEAHIRSTGTAA